jgi:hypothetical protein
MRLKVAGVGNVGAEEVAEIKAKVLTREMTRRETHRLFSNAEAAQTRDRSVVEKLFVQTPGARTPVRLEKTAVTEKWISDKLRSGLSKLSPKDSLKRARRFGDQMQHTVDKAMDHVKKDGSNFTKKFEHANRAERAAGKAYAADSELHSKTAAVDAWFEKNAGTFGTEAQRRYPELLKASMAPGVGTTPSPLTTPGAKVPRTATGGTPPVPSILGRP